MRRYKPRGLSPEGLVPVTEMPRMRKCYGYMSFTGEELLDHLPRGRKRVSFALDPKKVFRIKPEAQYTAIIYEYIERDGCDDRAACQSALDFLWLTGFNGVGVMKAENWANGVLLDHSDVVHPRGAGWSPPSYRRLRADQALID